MDVILRLAGGLVWIYAVFAVWAVIDQLRGRHVSR